MLNLINKFKIGQELLTITIESKLLIIDDCSLLKNAFDSQNELNSQSNHLNDGNNLNK